MRPNSSRMSIGSTTHVEDEKKELLKDIHKLPTLGLKYSVFVKINESFDMRDDDILTYQDRLGVPDLDDLWTRIIVENHGSTYSIYPGCTNMYHDLKQIYWWDGMKKDNVDYATKSSNCQKKSIGTQVKPSTTFHPQIDGLAERTIHTLEDMLRACVIDIKGGLGLQLGGLRLANHSFWVQRSFMRPYRMSWKGKLSLRYVGPYEILQRVGKVAYEMAFLEELPFVYPVFHISMLKKFLCNPALFLDFEGLGFDENMSYEEGSRWEADADISSRYTYLISS
ncbi:hypothetical protein EJD97_022786 [Solanum chilense]|uniref:Uncharacterized protein n=1 Tax=Solanum chilense TaxID=4083 RepID=A0A6N2C903_SOLCI|nr:hypothetical protein EJD97_022786 [Solanum chilense]